MTWADIRRHHPHQWLLVVALLAYVEAILTFRGRSLLLRDTLLDMGSSSTIFAADRL
jgi:hypothetical protein